MNTILFGGFDNQGKKYLASVDMYGTFIESDFAVGGIGKHYCKVILTKEADPEMSEEKAREVLTKCLKVLFAGDSRATDKAQFCTITGRGVTIEEPVTIKIEWEYKAFIERTNEKLYSIKLS